MELVIASLPLPVRLSPASAMSDAGLLRFSRENRPLRIEREANGDLLIMTPTGNRTGKMNQRIGRLLDEWTERDGRGVTFDSDTGFRLPNGAVRSPDASWLSNEKWNTLTEEQQDGFGMCPDFIIELNSPSDSFVAAETKILEEWLPNGVQLAWLIDPDRRTVTVFRPYAEPEMLENPSSVQGTGCVAGFELVMQRVWG